MNREDLYMRSFRGEDGFNEFVESLGGNPAAVTQAADLIPSLPKGLINFESFAGGCTLFEEAAAQTGEPYFGLKWALHQPSDFRFSGPNVLLVSMSANARQWIDMAIKYQKIHTNGFSYHYEEDEAANSVTGVISVHPLAPPCRQILEQLVAGIANLGCQFIPDFKLNLVTFQHGPPEDMSLYEQILQCPVIFNADRNTIVADHHYIKQNRTDFLTKLTTPFVNQYLNWQLIKHPKAKQSITMVVAETIPAILGVKGSDIKHASLVLNIHPKKLQRLLKQEGTSYSETLDGVRMNIANRLLIESEISIERLAKMLDYSSDRPFTVATKRWFGMAARDYRKTAKTHSIASFAKAKPMPIYSHPS